MKIVQTLLLTSLLILTSQFLRAQDRSVNLSDAEKIAGLSKFWSEASYNFAYFDKTNINWDSTYQAFIPQVLATQTTYEYYRTLERFCALLKDGHTNINAPWSLYGYSTYVPLRFVMIDQKPYVTRVLNGLSDSVPVGSELLTVKGQPVQQYLDKEVFPYIASSTEQQKWNTALMQFWRATTDTTTSYPMTFRTPKGQTISFNSRLFSQRERDGSKWVLGDGTSPAKSQLSRLTMLPGNIAHVELNSFGEEKIVDEFKAMLPQLRTAKGIILDIRQNGGGDTGIGAEILKYFTTEKRLIGSAWRTREHRPAFKAWGSYYATQKLDSARAKNEFYQRALKTAKGDFWYKGDTMTFDNSIREPKLLVPVMVLAGSNTGSAAEDFLILIRQLKTTRIPIIGEPSMGTTGQPLSFSLPGGGSARVCTKRDTYADGTDFVGVGVKPDVVVKPTVQSLITGNDVVLERAVAMLTGKTSLANQSK
ncbi:S41 family peptidase [Spirosoma endbachense]|uniref:Peptidase S41 n=1 Tax=Spirosoma endbachense TaxID=2666025 RepID=A0A6P1VPL9_9BACT|nr:S41 family peptidase [Spirosoma endbachense]QHV94564.1 peptidase S41 [Spirosoma endbachense]